MTDSDDLLFATIDSIPLLDKELAAKEILTLPKQYSFWDDYRYTEMFSLMTKNAKTGKQEIMNLQQGDFVWTKFTPESIKDWCEDYVFPWLGSKTRVMALVTQPGIANHEHIDCSKHELNTRQHKIRIVLQGRTDTLYWITDKGNVHAPNVNSVFVMDGGWPHGMANTTDIPKVTIALGSPWAGKEHYDDLTILQRRSDYKMPKQIDHLWWKE